MQIRCSGSLFAKYLRPGPRMVLQDGSMRKRLCWIMSFLRVGGAAGEHVSVSEVSGEFLLHEHFMRLQIRMFEIGKEFISQFLRQAHTNRQTDSPSRAAFRQFILEDFMTHGDLVRRWGINAQRAK